MESIMQSGTDLGEIVRWLCTAAVVLLFSYKVFDMVFPWIKGKIMRDVQLDQTDEALLKQLKDMEERFTGEIKSIRSQLDRMNEKLDNDNSRIHVVERKASRLDQLVTASLAERRILMKATLATLEGIQELGANGPVKEAQKELKEYLINSIHDE